MIICLGENLRRLRTEKGVTQEQFGFELGVSAQAVSRWENGVTYPDITMLPMIADYFDITLDELVGRARELTTEERNEFFVKMKTLGDAGNREEVLEEHTRMLKKYPNDVYLLHSKANLLYMQYKKNPDPVLAREIISLCNKINCSNKPDMQCGAMGLLVRVYSRLGEVEKARELANLLPSFEVGRELMIAECLQGKEREENYRYLIERLEGKIEMYRKRLEGKNT